MLYTHPSLLSTWLSVCYRLFMEPLFLLGIYSLLCFSDGVDCICNFYLDSGVDSRSRSRSSEHPIQPAMVLWFSHGHVTLIGPELSVPIFVSIAVKTVFPP